MNEEDIIKNSKEYKYSKNICGIYFLIKDGKIVYVGQSVNILERIKTHYYSLKEFNRFYYIECKKEELNKLEGEYIFKFFPIYNKKIPEHSTFKTLNQIKKYFAKMELQERLVDLYITFKKISKSKLYDIKLFDDLYLFMMWMYINNGIPHTLEYDGWDLADFLHIEGYEE
jgi:hypothetical protein